MVGEDRFAAPEHRPPVGLEGIGCIVQRDPEQIPDELIGQPIEYIFDNGVIGGPPALDKPAPEHAIVAFQKGFPVPHHIVAIVRFIPHHDDRRIPGHGIDPLADRAAESPWARVEDGNQLGNFLCRFF